MKQVFRVFWGCTLAAALALTGCGRGGAPGSSGAGSMSGSWAITGEFGLGCIGLLIMFTGFGQVVIYYTQQHKAPQSNGQPDNTKTGFPEKNEEK